MFSSLALAEGIHVKSAELQPADSGYVLDANFDVELTPTLDEALLRGLTLHFRTEFELIHPRWWTLSLWNRTVADWWKEQRLSYNALTRQYRLSTGALHQNFDTLAEALTVIGNVNTGSVVGARELDRDEIYLAAVRLRLDNSHLPKPLQLDAFGSRNWNLNSDWYRWTFRP